jgi:hypothetical protein
LILSSPQLSRSSIPSTSTICALRIGCWCCYWIHPQTFTFIWVPSVVSMNANLVSLCPFRHHYWLQIGGATTFWVCSMYSTATWPGMILKGVLPYTDKWSTLITFRINVWMWWLRLLNPEYRLRLSWKATRIITKARYIYSLFRCFEFF